MKLKELFLLLFIFFLASCSSIQEETSNSSSIKEYEDEKTHIELIQSYNDNDSPLKAQIIGDRQLWVYQPISNDKSIGHYFQKNNLDDFMLYSSTVFGAMNSDNSFNPETYLTAGSNKEFAIRARKSGSNDPIVWFPEHENIGTAFADEQIIKFDGIKQDLFNPGKLTNVNEVEIYQSVSFKHPNYTDPLAKLELVTRISNRGVEYDGTITWLEETEIERGYVGMLPTTVPPMKELFTSNNYSYELLTTGITDLIESNKIKSFGFKSYTQEFNGVPHNIILLEQINEPAKTLRLNENGIREPEEIWLEHRSESVQKVYPQIYDNYLVREGDTLSFSISIFAGLYPTS